MTVQCLTELISKGHILKKHRPLENTRPMHGACTACMEMCVSGVWIGTETTQLKLLLTLVALKLACSAWSVVEVGASVPLAAGLRDAAESSHRIAAST